MECIFCKNGITRYGETTVTLNREQTTLILKHVPAEICENCGEYYLSEEITEKVLESATHAVSRNAEVEILKFAA